MGRLREFDQARGERELVDVAGWSAVSNCVSNWSELGHG